MTISMSWSLQGILPALVTPFTAGGDAVDETGLCSLIDYLVGSGVHGLVALGGTGETVALTPAERQHVLEKTVEHTNRRVPVLAGILTPGLAEARLEARAAQAAGVDGLMVVTPYYVSPSQDGLYAAFCKLAEGIELPWVLYNIPYRTGVNLLPETVARLAEAIPNLVGVKECVQDIGQVAELIRLTGDRLAVLSGEEYLALSEWGLGAQGAVLASANLMPHLWLEIWQSWQNHDLATARDIYLRILPLLRAIFSECNPGPLKKIMSLAGLPAGPARLPILPPRHETIQRLQEAMRQTGITAAGS